MGLRGNVAVQKAIKEEKGNKREEHLHWSTVLCNLVYYCGGSVCVIWWYLGGGNIFGWWECIWVMGVYLGDGSVYV